MMGASVTPWPGTTMMDRVSLDDIPHKGKILPFLTRLKNAWNVLTEFWSFILISRLKRLR